MSISKPLTFEEIAVGSHFISFPLDGDDSGHGGYRGAHRVFKKLSDAQTATLTENAVTTETGSLSHMPPGMRVLPVLV